MAVALGNRLVSVAARPEEVMAVLREAMGDTQPLVREHGAWALSVAE